MAPLETLPAHKVRDMLFADLYLGHPKMGNRFSEVPKAPTNPVKAGPELQDDLEMLRKACAYAEAQAKGLPDFRIEYDGYAYRVAVLQSVSGTVYVLRRMPPQIPSLRELGLPQLYSQKLMQEGLTGLVIISGAMKSGKTTAAGALVAERLVAYGGVAVTAEDPVEMPLEGTHGPGICFQTQAASNEGGYAAATRNILRSGANLIFLGEMRDGEAALEVLRAGVNGHLIVSTLHAEDIQTALRRLEVMASEGMEAASAQALMSDGLAMVLHLRLTGNNPRRLEAEMLTVRTNSSARAIIRSGHYERLGSEISLQKTQMLTGRMG
ncbi:ATPase, T2SS/T4P/T4SS family [Aromatoleum evansii]|uniref:ATPase, T2SS/T4P/T4SS family n=1 Tax=Aromatoleum evansii TaxID=59406 RepID=UPI00145EEA9C|nr:ATPase, T2SS/T4P/T4SS family [Aromatoleum evansii]NMG28351.1 secretion system protein E [Aromatoleum evansii]